MFEEKKLPFLILSPIFFGVYKSEKNLKKILCNNICSLHTILPPKSSPIFLKEKLKE